MTLGITEVTLGGFQSCLQMSTNGHAWKRACNFCNDIVKERLFYSGLSRAIKQGSTTHEPPSKHQSMEWKQIRAQEQEIQKCAFCRKNDVDVVLGH
jgi:hypothetical protein